ncbi:hypothetical protein BT69DRAFT_1294292 [Atractiella rhizophila]|nr:hypothetical protein BT69DRAFT_1294292 [Atractiella rhizophila]
MSSTHDALRWDRPIVQHILHQKSSLPYSLNPTAEILEAPVTAAPLSISTVISMHLEAQFEAELSTYVSPTSTLKARKLLLLQLRTPDGSQRRGHSISKALNKHIDEFVDWHACVWNKAWILKQAERRNYRKEGPAPSLSADDPNVTRKGPPPQRVSSRTTETVFCSEGVSKYLTLIVSFPSGWMSRKKAALLKRGSDKTIRKHRRSQNQKEKPTEMEQELDFETPWPPERDRRALERSHSVVDRFGLQDPRKG